MNHINVGVIGYGYWGPNLVRNFVELPDSEVIIVADLNENRLSQVKARYPTVSTTQNYTDLFSLGLDAVVIASPPATHFRFAWECLEQGLHVLVEKPLTLDSHQAEDLVMLAETNDRILMVGHTFEYNPAVHALKKLVESGDLGDIHYIDAARLNLGLFQPDLNVLWDLAPHDISILCYLLGKTPESISAQGKACVFDNIHDVVYINMVFPGDILAHVHISWLDPCKVRRITVVGSKKMAVYNDVSTLEMIKVYDKGVEAPQYTNNFGEFHCSYRYGDVLIPNIQFIEPLRLECQHFLHCIANHQKPRSCGEDGLNVVRVLEAAQRSLVNSGHQEFIQWEPALLMNRL
jgi:predicted dehydrogenase